jgi:hypothetical protein
MERWSVGWEAVDEAPHLSDFEASTEFSRGTLQSVVRDEVLSFECVGCRFSNQDR